MSAYEALAGVYDRLTGDVNYERRADYIEKLFKKSRIPVHTVLDLACGTGNITLPLASLGYDMIGIGWTLDTANFFGGLLRMLFPFSLGMLMSRRFRMQENQGQKSGIMSFIARNIFWIAIILMFVLFSMPYFPKTGTLSVNGIYELFCIIIVFPFIVWFGAAGNITSKFSTKLCKFLGDISYPLYIVHYPVMYLFYSWLIDNKLYTLGETWQVVILVMVVNIALAYACLKLYDEPVRKRLLIRIDN